MEQKGFTKIIKIIINRCNNCVDVRINQTILESALKFGPFFEHLLQFNSSIYKIEIWAEIHQALLSQLLLLVLYCKKPNED